MRPSAQTVVDSAAWRCAGLEALPVADRRRPALMFVSIVDVVGVSAGSPVLRCFVEVAQARRDDLPTEIALLPRRQRSPLG
jgi:hypothetical protein